MADPARNDEYVVSMEGISKSFGVVRALDDATLRLRRGSIHGLVGANGAGKSTIIKVLAGILEPNEGRIVIDGQEVTDLTPATVEEMGVHFIHQDRLLVPTATVGEAIYLHHEPRFGPFMNLRAMRRDAAALLKRYFDMELPGDALIRDLTTAQQKIVQITQALARDAKVLVLDEPTASLVKKEVDSLFNVLKRLRDDGIAVVFISHYMQEIDEICDEVTVMRNGTDVGVVSPREVGIEAIVSMMIAQDISEMYPPRVPNIGAPMFEVDKLGFAGEFEDVSFTVHAGEVLGLTGLLGSGAKHLVKCLFGLEQAETGQIRLDGKRIDPKSPGQAVNHGIALLPEGRREHGVALGLSVAENIELASLDRYSTTGGMVSLTREREISDDLIRSLAIKTPHRNELVRNLSGGNQQKVAIAKWLSCQSKVYILDEPTVAVDIGAKVEIYNLINTLASEGAAILVMSSELEELVGICDRTVVIYRGEITAEFSKEDADTDKLLAAASGASAPIAQREGRMTVTTPDATMMDMAAERERGARQAASCRACAAPRCARHVRHHHALLCLHGRGASRRRSTSRTSSNRPRSWGFWPSGWRWF